jgi:uncharacterized protein YjeT (DUF2065 family)
MDLTWGDLLVGLGLALVIEGLAYAIFARPLKRMVMEVLATPEFTVRLIGLAIAAIGVILVWLARG